MTITSFFTAIQENFLSGSSASALPKDDSAVVLGGHITLVSAGFFFSVVGGGAAVQFGRALCKNISLKTRECVALGVVAGGSLLFSGLNVLSANSLEIEKIYVPIVAGGTVLGVGSMTVYALRHKICSQQSSERDSLLV